MNAPRGSKTIQIIFPYELLEELDAAAKSYYISRSEFIRQCIMLRLENPPGIKAKEVEQLGGYSQRMLADKSGELFDLERLIC